MRPAKERKAEVERKKKALTLGSRMMLNKNLRRVLRTPAPPSNPYAALMAPCVIVPTDPDEKVVIADAGSVVKLCDQRIMYRDRISPVTHRADEILVLYGKPDKPLFGWLSDKLPKTALKPVKGPTFLVMTKNEDALIAWEQFRLRIGRARKSDPSMWVAPWLALHGSKYPSQLREVTRFFGGKPIKNESFDDRCMRLFTLIIHTELDMATAKKGAKKGKGKKAKDTIVEKAVKKTKGAAAKTIVKRSKSGAATKANAKKGDFSPRSREFDDYIIKRLVKENPRRAGSSKAVIWGYLKKGMTVGQFVAKGGTRAAVGRYVENGWIKLLRAKGSADSE